MLFSFLIYFLKIFIIKIYFLCVLLHYIFVVVQYIFVVVLLLYCAFSGTSYKYPSYVFS